MLSANCVPDVARIMFSSSAIFISPLLLYFLVLYDLYLRYLSASLVYDSNNIIQIILLEQFSSFTNSTKACQVQHTIEQRRES